MSDDLRTHDAEFDGTLPSARRGAARQSRESRLLPTQRRARAVSSGDARAPPATVGRLEAVAVAVLVVMVVAVAVPPPPMFTVLTSGDDGGAASSAAPTSQEPKDTPHFIILLCP